MRSGYLARPKMLSTVYRQCQSRNDGIPTNIVRTEKSRLPSTVVRPTMLAMDRVKGRALPKVSMVPSSFCKKNRGNDNVTL
mmetsp:Transcript_2465/g.3904  ORF Transcript_2465/g.3904 Transcript_2465/m.3904 type:complete len:81 (-) Transcript_2465:637-879(-)